jgi:capsular polysaccharide transport system permease protein
MRLTIIRELMASESVNNHTGSTTQGGDAKSGSGKRHAIKAVHRKLVNRLARLGSFALVLAASMLIVVYFTLIASPRYVSEARFVVKQSDGNDLPLSGLASLGAVSGSMKDALIIKTFVESRDMALLLDQKIGLKSHYQQSSVDLISRMSSDASVEMYVKYYNDHIHVHHDEMSDIVYIEVQAFDRDYALLLGKTVLELSEQFINAIGDKMAHEQMDYASREVSRVHEILQQQQQRLLEFQDENRLYSPAQEGSSLLAAVGQLQSDVIQAEAKLKELLSVLRDDTAEVRSQKNLIRSLKAQLSEERARLTSNSNESLNKVNSEYQEIELSAALASDLYKSSLASYETVRSEAYRKLKHLLIVQQPSMPEEDTYPRRLYNIITWFSGLLLVYLVGRLIVAIVNEHRD